VNPILSSLLLDLSNMSDEEAEDLTFHKYIETYTTRQTRKGRVGEMKAHDGEPVTFTEWRFDHAFFTSVDKTTRPYNKSKFDRNRAQRILWIGKIVQGHIPSAECYHIPAPGRRDISGRLMVRRLYLIWEELYMIWLEPRSNGGWWFSSAYVEYRGKDYVRRIVRKGWKK